MLPTAGTTGKIIGDNVQYRLESPVAMGAFSTVYRCTELASGRTYAMKIIDKKVAADNHMKEALIREVNALEIAGSSPYVTTLVDKMVSKHNYYLVMELSEGGTLLDLIREQRQELRVLQASLSGSHNMSESLRSSVPPVMQYDRVQHFFKQLLLALSSLHERDVVHRDVKPENILLNKRRTRLVLSDFGFACHALPGTELHRACGTLRYCAPELLHENPRYDGRKVDVWAAGVTLYVMLFGGHPFRCPSQDPDTLLEVITTTRYRIPRPIPADIEDMLQHMLCVNPVERWSVRQLLQHPWMAALGAELRSPSLRSASATARTFTSPATAGATASSSSHPNGPTDTAESVVELLAEDCPPIDAIPSDDEVVDDGFYQSSTDDKQSSISSSSPTQSGVSSHIPASTMPDTQTGSVVRLVGTQEKAGAPPASADAPAAMNPATLAAVEVTAAAPASASSAAAPSTTPTAAAAAKREVLQQGSVSTSMVSIESCADSDDEDGVDDGGADGMGSDHTGHDAAAAPMRRPRRASSDAGSSVSTNNTFCDDGQLEVWWVRYTYGLYLTARIVARFIAFVSVCVVAVVVRVVLRCDIVDLPLPEALRTRISFLLSTPLRRSHLVGHEQNAVAGGPPSPLSATRRGSSPSFHTQGARKVAREAGGGAPGMDSYPSRQTNMSPIPGSGLRHYVRTADQLMRDSFVGNAVLEHNASLADVRAPPPPAPPAEEHSGESLTSSPAAPSLATIAPAAKSLAQSLLLGEGLSPTPSMDTRSDRDGDWIERPNSVERQGGSRCNSTARSAETNSPADGDVAIASTHDTPLLSLVATSSSPVPEVAAAAAAAVKRTASCAKLGGKHPDSQSGATDTTESGDSGEEKSTDQPGHHQYMLSPIAPLPRVFPGHRQRSEDFPIVGDNPATP